MKITEFSKYIFWSYKENADLPDEVIIRNVCLLGEFTDLYKLLELYPKENIKNELSNLLAKDKKRVNLIERVLL
jgi:hypothetical protein